MNYDLEYYQNLVSEGLGLFKEKLPYMKMPFLDKNLETFNVDFASGKIKEQMIKMNRMAAYFYKENSILINPDFISNVSENEKFRMIVHELCHMASTDLVNKICGFCQPNGALEAITEGVTELVTAYLISDKNEMISYPYEVENVVAIGQMVNTKYIVQKYFEADAASFITALITETEDEENIIKFITLSDEAIRFRYNKEEIKKSNKYTEGKLTLLDLYESFLKKEIVAGKINSTADVALTVNNIRENEFAKHTIDINKEIGGVDKKAENEKMIQVLQDSKKFLSDVTSCTPSIGQQI